MLLTQGLVNSFAERNTKLLQKKLPVLDNCKCSSEDSTGLCGEKFFTFELDTEWASQFKFHNTLG